MRISRIYLPICGSDINDSVIIEGEKAHYIRNVLRLKKGFVLHFFTPSGHQYQANIQDVAKHQVVLGNINLTQEQPQSSQLQTTLAQGISSSDRMDYSIQKAAELGCVRLIPFLSEFCSSKVPEHKYEKKLKHWQAVAISACEQSGRTDIMQIEAIHSITDVVNIISTGIYLEPTASTSLHDLPENLQQKQCFLIGPEGGFSPDEINLFKEKEYIGVQLGHRVLRTETVAPVIMGAMHALYGDFRS